MSASAVLETRDLKRHFGGVAALDGLDFRIPRGEVRCVIGPNGAGKTTFLNVVSGLVRPSAGSVTFEGRDVTGMSAKAVANLGVIRTFQTPTVFPGLTVRVNLELGATRPGAPSRGAEERVESLLEELALGGRGVDHARDLSHSEKKRLELGMVLAAAPRLVMLDEPTAGMSIRETDEIVTVLRRLLGETTVLIVEHDMSFIQQIADRVSVFHRGALLMEGSLAEVKADRRVQDIYLGSAND